QCTILSSEDSASFPLPYDLLNRDGGLFKVYGPTDDAYEINMSALGLTVDGTYAGGVDGLRIVSWVGGNWFINADDGIYEYDGASVSTNYTERIDDVLDFIEVFVRRNSLVGRDAGAYNVLKQYDSAFGADPDLTLPANLIIT